MSTLSGRAQGWIIGILATIGIAGYFALSLAGKGTEANAVLIVVLGPIIALLTGRKVEQAKDETVRQTVDHLQNGTLVTGVKNALLHPEVLPVLQNIVKAAVQDVIDPVTKKER